MRIPTREEGPMRIPTLEEGPMRIPTSVFLIFEGGFASVGAVYQH
jgi:hypothetical protein